MEKGRRHTLVEGSGEFHLPREPANAVSTKLRDLIEFLPLSYQRETSLLLPFLENPSLPTDGLRLASCAIDAEVFLSFRLFLDFLFEPALVV